MTERMQLGTKPEKSQPKTSHKQMVWHSLACFKWEHLSDPEFHQIIQMTCENDLETLTWHFDVTRDQLWFLQAPKNVLQESELRQCKSNNPPL